MKKEKLNLGIDIGGTKVNLGIVTDKGEIVDKCRMETNTEGDIRAFVKKIAYNISALLEENKLNLKDIESIGIGVPGTVDTKTGVVSYCPNLSWYDVPLKEYFENELGHSVLIAQDSRNAALAEYLFGAGKDYQDIICVAVGTGIGCGIVINGKIFNGRMNTAGELGHMPIVKDGRTCVCGNKGCLEKYASGNGMIEIAVEKYPDKFKNKEKKCESIFEMIYAGDEEMKNFLDECVDNLGFGIANAVTLLAPEAVIISGGLCEHEALFVNPLKEKINKYGYYSWTRLNQLKVHRALLGSDAPMIGAAVLKMGI